MTVLLLVIAGAAIVLLLLLSALIGKSPKIALYAITLLSVIVWDFPKPLSIGTVGGASVQVEDALIAAMVLSVMFRPQRFLTSVKPYMLAVLITGLAVAAALIYGMAEFGPSAMNEFRSFLYPLASVAWGLNQNWGDEAWQSVVRRWAIVTGALLSLTAVFHAALYGLGKVDGFVVSVVSGLEQTARPLTAGQAILLALIALYLLQGLSKKSRADMIWAGAFVVIVLVAQHRSVWIALAAGCVILSFKVRGVARARIVVGALMAAWAGAILVLAGVVDVFAEQIAYSVDNLGTYDARTTSWGALIDQTVAGGLGPIAFGSPFGTGYSRVENGTLVEWSPHNWYVTVYLRIGLIGLGAFLVMLLLILIRLLKTKDVAAAAAVFVAILFYCWAYSLPWHVAPFFAWAMYVAGRHASERADKKSQPPAPYKKRARRQSPHLARIEQALISKQ